MPSNKPISIKQKRRSVLITGGTGSVGRALVKAFCAQGHDVTFQYCGNESGASRLKRLFNTDAIRVDFATDFSLPRIDFDIVVNNAGINVCDVRTQEVSLEDWDRTIRINTTAPFLVIRQCLPFMMRKKWGRIINISSIYGLGGVEGRAAYVASKHGLSGLTKTVAREYAKHGITSNEICPGPIDSDMMRKIAARSAETEGGTARSYLREVCAEIPAARMLRPVELTALAVFLASPDAAYLNGVSIPLDGGMTA